MNKTIFVKHYGTFRKYGEGMTLGFQAGLTVLEMKKRIAAKMESPESALVFDSALSQGSRILRDADVLETAEELSILPPVCGG